MENQGHGAMTGANGDYLINAGETISTQKFSHIIILTDAVIDDVKIATVSVKTARNYGTLPANYTMCAGKGKYFDYIKLTSGTAEGINYFNESEI